MNFPNSVTIISDEVSQNLPDVVRFVQTFRLPGIELRSMFGRAFKDLTPADVGEIGRTAEGEGWRIFGCASPVFKCELDDAAAVAAHLEGFRRSVEVAHALNCDLVRVFTFLRRAGDEHQRRLDRIAAYLERLAELAAGSNVRVGVENEHSCAVATGAELAALLARLPNSRIGIVWDPCNIRYLTGSVTDTPETFPAIAPRLFHVHVKDAARVTTASGDLATSAMPVGLGEVGWRTHLAEISHCGYRGMFSLETHWRIDPLAEEKLHLPAGYAFSKGGEEASRICLRNLEALMAVST